MKTYNVIWASSAGSRPNALTPSIGEFGALIIPESVVEEVYRKEATLAFDAEDAVAEAVVSATLGNVAERWALDEANASEPEVV